MHARLAVEDSTTPLLRRPPPRLRVVPRPSAPATPLEQAILDYVERRAAARG